MVYGIIGMINFAHGDIFMLGGFAALITFLVLTSVFVGLPVVISFTVETDGRLPTGESLADAITQVDAATGNAPAYYMINCAHPSHFEAMLADGDAWTTRIRGIRANASRRSHAELDEATELDCGDPETFGAEHQRLIAAHPSITILGGCCGTDERHVEAIARAVGGR